MLAVLQTLAFIVFCIWSAFSAAIPLESCLECFGREYNFLFLILRGSPRSSPSLFLRLLLRSTIFFNTQIDIVMNEALEEAN